MLNRLLQHNWNHGKREHVSNAGIVFVSYRCSGSVDELLAHPFVKHPKKISNDPQNLADDMAKILSVYKQNDLIDHEPNIDPGYGRKKEKCSSIDQFVFLLFHR